MDEAFLTLLAKKDFEYITIKEICEVAGVNRSTFYLHYETMSDLLSESVGRMNEQFLASMEKDSDAFSTKLRNCPRDELYLITPDYLTPYLSYIKNNKRLFQIVQHRNPYVLHYCETLSEEHMGQLHDAPVHAYVQMEDP